MHLPVFAHQGAVGVDDGRGVVVEARRAPLEERGDDHGAAFARDLAERLGGRPRYLLGKLEILVVLRLAKVLGAEKLRQADDIRAAARGVTHHIAGPGQILLRVRPAAHLHDAKDRAHHD